MDENKIMETQEKIRENEENMKKSQYLFNQIKKLMEIIGGD